MAAESFWHFTLPELVNMVASTVTAVTALVMAYLAWRTYIKEPEQEADDAEQPQTESAAPAEPLTELIVFKTKVQTTRLLPTARGLECHLDDKREGRRSGHQWSLGPSELEDILSNRRFHVYPGNRSNSGTFTIGPRRNWLYSRRLFPEADMLDGALQDVIKAAIDTAEV